MGGEKPLPLCHLDCGIVPHVAKSNTFSEVVFRRTDSLHNGTNLARYSNRLSLASFATYCSRILCGSIARYGDLGAERRKLRKLIEPEQCDRSHSGSGCVIL
ncbi:hypothetical protein PHSY_002612 [Pseudozyma hubeiensis SY62]|uniref:Uncharacterized protein n=1 Tax=Pseudozyma hubeiensis (strain SY62) TaxID=1305764 RepID=R9P1M0_PSEHS|nr:hypothetical protein PHSY_002612 [Pseudozyma hubeiensis SY62]GAC95037.1 hypothetical protein PHSY_002612 [Pseudozyma hubeiensis SY62]